MKPEVSYNEEYGVTIMRIPENAGFSDRIDLEESGRFVDRLLVFLDKSQHRYLICNVSASANSLPSKEMRRCITKQGERMRLDKTAVVGVSPVMRMITKVMVAEIRQSDKNRFFGMEKEALSWFGKKVPVTTWTSKSVIN